MIPKITTATLRAGLSAACPPGETVQCAVYGRISTDSVPLPTDGIPCFAGLTDHGTLVVIRFFAEEKPRVSYDSLLSLKKVRIIGAFQRYLIRLTFFASHFQHEYSLLVSGSPHGVTLPYQPENMNELIRKLRLLT